MTGNIPTDGVNPPGCICRYQHKSDPMCQYQPPLASKDQLTSAAHKAVTDFVNGLKPQSTEDVVTALQALAGMAVTALDTVMNGKCEKLS